LRIWALPEIEIKPFAEVVDEREVALFYSAAAHSAVEGRLRLDPVSRREVIEATESHFSALSEDLTGDVIYAVGGGVAVDAAKYVGFKTGRPVVSLPTAMTVDAFFTWASGVREAGCVRYVETGPPERVVIDLDVLGSAPDTLRAAGVCDLLSIVTGSWDWRFARDHDQLDASTRYQGWADDVAKSILNAAIDCAEAAGRGDADGLKQLVDGLALEVQLCNQVGHSRPEEGSEHYFAYAVENQIADPLPHGDLVGPGIVLMARIQGQETSLLERALKEARVPLTSLPEQAILGTLEQLPKYVQTHGLPYGITHEMPGLPEGLVEGLT